MKGWKVQYSTGELCWIKAHKTMVRPQAHEAFCLKFDRKDVSLTNYVALCKRKGWFTGRDGRYPKGSVPANKGKKMPFNANSARTQFKKGGLPGNTKYLGHERVSKDGYVEISIDETNPHTGFERRYVLKHRWLWVQENGPLEDGMCLKCLDGNKQNCNPSNWKSIPRAMLPRLNGRFGRDYDKAEPEVKPLILAITELEHQTRQTKPSEEIS